MDAAFLIPREEEGGRGRGHDQPPCRRHGCQIEFFTPSPRKKQAIAAMLIGRRDIVLSAS